MAYNGYYPNMYPQYLNIGQNQQVQQQPQTGIIWVQGEAGAKSYLVAPNTTVQLWDSEAQVIYLKSADASGMPSMKIIDYTIRDMSTPAQQPSPAISYVTQKEFDEFKQQVQQLIGGRKDEPTVSTADDKRRNR